MRRELWPGDEHPGEVAQFFRGEIEEPEAVLVAEEAGALIGFAELSVRRPPAMGYLEGWWVDPAHRRKGVGRALVAASEDWARAQGCTEFGSDTEIHNTASAAAHQAVGFTEMEQLRMFRKPL